MTREQLQKEAVDSINKYHRVALQWCTGLGKSKAAIEIIKYLDNVRFLYTAKPKLKILLVVAEIPHKDNWEKEIKKWSNTPYDIEMVCYASLKNYQNTNWDLIIYDEAHHLGSDLRLSFLSTIVADDILLLSATIPDYLLSQLSTIYGSFYSSKVTLSEAIKWEILSEPKVYLIPLYLNSSKYDCEIVEEWGKGKRKTIYCNFSDRWKYIKNKTQYPNVKLIIRCTQRQKYNYLSEQYEHYKKAFQQTRIEFVKNKWLRLGLERKKFLGDTKTPYVKELLNKLNKNRFICFCNNIKQVEYLGGKNCIHSKKKNSLDIIESFNNKKIDHLFAVGMLQEGQNLTDIEAGIIVQLDGTERSFIQKFGRSMRAEDPVQYIFYYPNTRDEEYLQKAIETIDDKYIEYKELNEI